MTKTEKKQAKYDARAPERAARLEKEKTVVENNLFSKQLKYYEGGFGVLEPAYIDFRKQFFDFHFDACEAKICSAELMDNKAKELIRKVSKDIITTKDLEENKRLNDEMDGLANIFLNRWIVEAYEGMKRFKRNPSKFLKTCDN